MSRSTAPARPATTFGQLGLPEPVVTTLARRGLTTPFPIQAAAIPDALAGRDVLGKAQTGSGKTLAFGLPMISRLAGRKAAAGRPLALVLVPTRELAVQVHDALAPLGQPLGVRMTVVVGGLSMGKQIGALRRGVDVLVATPGRLKDLIEQRACALGDVEIVVLDEADHMADMGFLPAVRALLDQVRPGGQRLLFSATLDNAVQTLVDRYLKSPVTHTTAPVGDVDAMKMDHHLFVVSSTNKVAVAAEIANRDGRTLLFVRTKHGADRLTKQLRRVGVPAEALHGGKTQGARTRVLTDFRDGRLNALIATDVAARGIHVDNIDLVLHVDPAADHKDYLHRAGRTARAGESGVVVTLVTPEQERETEKMTRRAGVSAIRVLVAPGGTDLVRVTGARPTKGLPHVAEHPVAAVVSRPSGGPRGRRGGGRPSGQPGRKPTARSHSSGGHAPARPAARSGGIVEASRRARRSG